MTHRTVTFDDFSRGEYGDLGPRLPPDAGPGWYSGINVMTYRDGSVGPRPGLRAFARTGADWPDGEVHALFPSTNADQQTFAQIGALGRQIGVNLALMQLSVVDTFGDDPLPEPTSWPNNGQHRTDGNWVLVPSDGLYKATIGGGIAVVDGDMDGRAFKFYRDRQLVTPGSGQTYYSGPALAGWDTFDDFFTGTTFNEVTGFHELRNGLVIPQATPNLDMVTGTIGTSSAVLRRISSRTAPTDPYGCASIGGEFLVMMGRGLPFPMLYNGATWEELRHLRYAGPNAGVTSQVNGSIPAHTVVDLEYDDAWMILAGVDYPIVGTHRMLLSWGGARTVHQWDVQVAPFARRFNEGVTLLTDGGAVGDPPEFYSWFPDLDRPGFVSDPYSQPGDGTDVPLAGDLTLPAWVAEAGREVMVKGLVVAITRWNTGAAETNHFNVYVEARRRYGPTYTLGSTVQQYDEAGTEASSDGDDTVVHLGFGNQGYGTEFQVFFYGIRGCAIRSVTAVIEERAERI